MRPYPALPLLAQVYLERILSRQEVDAFAKGLKPHQMALLPDGTTVLERAVVQHNILSASKLYNNISLQVGGAVYCLVLLKAGEEHVSGVMQ